MARLETNTIDSFTCPSWLPPPVVPVKVVAGPPGSGKSTYVDEQVQPGEVVIDVDVIASEMTGKPLYHASENEVWAAMRERNRRLTALASSWQMGSTTGVWLIVAAGTEYERTFWRDRLKASVIVMPTPKDECIRRILADHRRPPEVKRSQIQAVGRWK